MRTPLYNSGTPLFQPPEIRTPLYKMELPSNEDTSIYSGTPLFQSSEMRTPLYTVEHTPLYQHPEMKIPLYVEEFGIEVFHSNSLKCDSGQLYCLQTRPIVTLPTSCFFDYSIQGGVATLWDNSNIVESYSGVTSPLTFSFASYAYETVNLVINKSCLI